MNTKAKTRGKETTKRNNQIYAEWKNGATKRELSRKYDLSYSIVECAIRERESAVRHGNEWHFKMSGRLARWLFYQNINSENDIYERIEKGESFRGSGFAKGLLKELNEEISRTVYIYEKTDSEVFLTFMPQETKRKTSVKKAKRIAGHFVGTIDGRKIEGFIDGEII